MHFPTSAFLRCVCIAIIAVFLGSLSLHAQAQTWTQSANMQVDLHAWYNPPDANPPYTAITPGSLDINVDYTLLASAQTQDPTVFMTELALFSYERDYYTQFATVPQNYGNPKYTAPANGSSYDMSHTWTLVNQAYGTYYWKAKGYNTGNEYGQSPLYGGYGNGS